MQDVYLLSPRIRTQDVLKTVASSAVVFVAYAAGIVNAWKAQKPLTTSIAVANLVEIARRVVEAWSRHI